MSHTYTEEELTVCINAIAESEGLHTDLGVGGTVVNHGGRVTLHIHPASLTSSLRPTSTASISITSNRLDTAADIIAFRDTFDRIERVRVKVATFFAKIGIPLPE